MKKFEFYNVYETVLKNEHEKFFLYKVIYILDLYFKSIILHFFSSLNIFGKEKFFIVKKESIEMNKLFCLRNNFIINDLFYNRINLYFRNYLKQWYFQTVFLRNEKIKKFKQKNKLQKIFIKEFKKDKKYYGKILLKKLKLYNIKYFEFYIKSICFLKIILYITQGYLKKYKMLFFSHIFNNNENNLNENKKLLFKKLIKK